MAHSMEANKNYSVKLSKSERKLAKKQAKASQMLFKHDGIHTVPNPTCNILVANGGLGNGIKREEIQQVFGCVGPVRSVVMLREKPYCFVQYSEVSLAVAAIRRLHGYELREGPGPASVNIYLSFVENVPADTETHTSQPPPGLVLIADFLDEQLEQRLMNSIDWDSHPETENQSLKHRRVKHHGYEFNYSTNNVDKDKPLPDGMPAFYSQIIDMIMETGHVQCRPDQLTINQYQPGQGIPPHVDTHSAFEDAIISLSLGSQVVMEFAHEDGHRVPMLLPRRSLLVMTGEARYLWSHGITPRKNDVIPDPLFPGNLTLHHRGQRTSFTFRAVRHHPCNCNYPSQCDSRKLRKNIPETPKVALPKSEEEAAQLEADQVHSVYDNIAGHFSGTRYKPWPRVVDFLSRLEPGSRVLDVGCGNGKYLAVNKHLYMIGCDRSSRLLGICRGRGLEGFICDSLALPVVTASLDACICIAVVHHLSTQTRRLHALRELSRVLCPGGKALVTVWAMEQERMKEKSKYICRKKPDIAGESLSGRDPSTHCSGASGRPCESEGFESTCQSLDRHAKGSVSGGRVHLDPAAEREGKSSSIAATGLKADSFPLPQQSGSDDEKTSKTNSFQPFEENSSTPKTSETCSPNVCVKEREKSEAVCNPGEISPQPGGRSGMAGCRTDDVGNTDRLRDPQTLDSDGRVGAEAGGESRETIAVHKNRTQFEQQDLLVPWHLHQKTQSASSDPSGDDSDIGGKKQVYFRFYHVFVEGEMEELCQEVAGVRVIDSYYDQGNWCVIFQKQ